MDGKNKYRRFSIDYKIHNISINATVDWPLYLFNIMLT